MHIYIYTYVGTYIRRCAFVCTCIYIYIYTYNIQSLFRAALPPSLAPDRYARTRSLSQAAVIKLHNGGWLHKGRHSHEDTNKHNQPRYETRENDERPCCRSRWSNHSAEQEKIESESNRPGPDHTTAMSCHPWGTT